jgi:hypothetical protein
MPVISMFYGIIVMMYYFDDRKHHQPHIHVECGDEEAVISIPDGNVIEGSIRTAKLRVSSGMDRNPSVRSNGRLETCDQRPTGV